MYGIEFYPRAPSYERFSVSSARSKWESWSDRKDFGGAEQQGRNHVRTICQREI
jgi:hypothetical protein